jgi:hypothetical protein
MIGNSGNGSAEGMHPLSTGFIGEMRLGFKLFYSSYLAIGKLPKT